MIFKNILSVFCGGYLYMWEGDGMQLILVSSIHFFTYPSRLFVL